MAQWLSTHIALAKDSVGFTAINHFRWLTTARELQRLRFGILSALKVSALMRTQDTHSHPCTHIIKNDKDKSF